MISNFIKHYLPSFQSLMVTFTIILGGNNEGITHRNTKIHWELNWLHQRDEHLIQFIREHILIPPPVKKGKLLLQKEYNEKKPWEYQGLDGQALIVEHLYGLSLEKNR